MMPRVSRVGSMGFPSGGWFINILLYFVMPVFSRLSIFVYCGLSFLVFVKVFLYF